MFVQLDVLQVVQELRWVVAFAIGNFLQTEVLRLLQFLDAFEA